MTDISEMFATVEEAALTMVGTTDVSAFLAMCRDMLEAFLFQRLADQKCRPDEESRSEAVRLAQMITNTIALRHAEIMGSAGANNSGRVQ